MRTSLKSTLLQSLAISWTASSEMSGGVWFFFGWWFSAFSGIRNQQKFMPWEDVLAFETNEFLVVDTICTTSAPRGFINIFCSSWSRCTCSRHEKNVICASQTFTPSQRWWKLWCLLCITQKTSKKQVHPKHVQMIANASMSPSLFSETASAFKMRCLAIFAKSLGPTCGNWVHQRPKKLRKSTKQFPTKSSTGMRCDLKSLTRLLMEEIRRTSWYGESSMIYRVLSEVVKDFFH